MDNLIKRFDQYKAAKAHNISEAEKPALRYFYDTEFIEDGETILLLSFGMVCEDGRELYLENLDAVSKADTASEWVKENVFPYLDMMNGDNKFAMSYKEIAKQVSDFILETKDAELWGYYSSYDHVALAQLFGPMIELPAHIPKFTMDIKQIGKMFDIEIPEMDETKYQNHNALSDAQWTKEAFYTMFDQLKTKIG